LKIERATRLVAETNIVADEIGVNLKENREMIEGARVKVFFFDIKIHSSILLLFTLIANYYIIYRRLKSMELLIQQIKQ
jgi:hypothetical protein